MILLLVLQSLFFMKIISVSTRDQVGGEAHYASEFQK